MEAGVFVKETRKKLSFRIPCWWCMDKDNFSVSAINKTLQQQRVLVLRDPWFYLDVEKIATLLRLKDSLINKGILKEEGNEEQLDKCSTQIEHLSAINVKLGKCDAPTSALRTFSFAFLIASRSTSWRKRLR